MVRPAHRDRQPPRYAELRCRSCFSFLAGASHPEELVARAAELGLSALALADANGLYGIVRAHAEAKRRGLPLVVGAELAVTGLELGRRGAARPARAGPRGVREPVPARHPRARRGGAAGPGAPARSAPAARTDARREREEVRVPLDDVRGRAGGLFALYPGADGEAAARLREAFGARLALAVARHRIAGEEARTRAARSIADRLGVAVAVTNDVHTHDRGAAAAAGRPHLRPARHVGRPGRAHGSSRTRSGRSRGPRRWRGCGPTSRRGSRTPPRSPTRAGSGWRRSAASTRCRRSWSTRRRSPAAPRSRCRARGRRTARRAMVPVPSPRLRTATPSDRPRASAATASVERRPRTRRAATSTPRRPTPEGARRGVSGMPLLRELVREGARWRYGGEPPEDVARQLAKELALVEQLGYASYFLTVWDVVRFARSRGILCQGRGSAANSAVCFVARDHRHRPGADGAALRAVHLRRARRAARHRRGLRARAARGGAPVRLRAVRPRPRRDGLRGHHLPRRSRRCATSGKALGLSLAQVDRLAKQLGMYDDLAEVGPERSSRRPGSTASTRSASG